MTKEEKVKTTKERILKVANELFATKGFAGASVREIAKEADVNIAAINYHFQNKEGLYWKVFEHSHELIENKVQELGKEASSTEELAILTMKFFMSKESALLNTFKMFLSGNVDITDDQLPYDEEYCSGPPGEEVFLEMIKSDLGDSASEMARMWAVKMIFSLLVHFTVISSTELLKVKSKQDPTLTPEGMEQMIRHSVRAFLLHVKSNPDLKVY